MNAEPIEPACPVARKLVLLLESRQRLAGNDGRSVFWERSAEIELDALLLDAAPGTRALIQVTREVMKFSEEITARIAKA